MSAGELLESFIAEAGSPRLDKLLAERLPRFSRAHLRGLIERGCVLVDGRPCRPDQRLRGGETVEVRAPARAWEEPAGFERWVLKEDREVLLLDKPAGLLMHPLGESWLSAPEAALDEPEASLAALLQLRRPEILRAAVPRCGIVHRLDRQTSGVLAVAKTAQAYEALIEAFRAREVEKVYNAVVRGVPSARGATVSAPVGRRPGHRKVSVTPFGKSAETAFKVLSSCAAGALVEARPLTGRTHQIRAHLAVLGHPVMGDPEFDRGRGPQPPRLMLHARRLRLTHPATGKPLEAEAPLPRDFKAFWAACRRAKA